jgi:vacuolar protein sorting-associated protein 35
VLLGACPELQPGVRVHVVMASLMDRLSRFAAQDGAIAAQFDAVDAFGKLKRAALRVSGDSQYSSGSRPPLHLW